MYDLNYNSLDAEFLQNIPSSCPLVGKGVDGAVYRLTENNCIKIYFDNKKAAAEIKAYKAVQGSTVFPQFYGSGSNYIIIEYIDGKSLRHYLEDHRTMSESIAKQLLTILQEIKRCGFTRNDASLRHILVTKHGELKFIDHVHAFEYDQPLPNHLFSSLKKLNLLEPFLEWVKVFDSEAFKDYENLARK